MTLARNNSSPIRDIGAESVVIADGGEEWCLLDEPRLQTGPSDWGRLEASHFQAVDSSSLAAELESGPGVGNGESTHAAEYQLNASHQFRDQLKKIYLADPAGRAEILAALQASMDQLRKAPLSESRFEFALPALGWQVRSVWPLPLVIQFAVDQANRAVYLHLAKDSCEVKP